MNCLITTHSLKVNEIDAPFKSATLQFTWEATDSHRNRHTLQGFYALKSSEVTTWENSRLRRCGVFDDLYTPTKLDTKPFHTRRICLFKAWWIGIPLVLAAFLFYLSFGAMGALQNHIFPLSSAKMSVTALVTVEQMASVWYAQLAASRFTPKLIGCMNKARTHRRTLQKFTKIASFQVRTTRDQHLSKFMSVVRQVWLDGERCTVPRTNYKFAPCALLRTFCYGDLEHPIILHLVAITRYEYHLFLATCKV